MGIRVPNRNPDKTRGLQLPVIDLATVHHSSQVSVLPVLSSMQYIRIYTVCPTPRNNLYL